MNLHHKTIVLTGAAGGIGAALAEALAEAGARLILVGRREAPLQRLRDRLPATAHGHGVLALDLSRETDIAELVRFCRDLPGGIDGLINNAGTSEFALVEDSDATAMRNIMALNLWAPMTLCQQLLPLLQTRPQAVIVNIGSVLGAIGHPGFAAYGASKAGLARFSEALRRELADTSIHLLHFNPRATDTPMNDRAVTALNAALGTRTDAPAVVAAAIVRRLTRDRFGEVSFGWPESLFVRINALLPKRVDRDFLGKLPVIRRYARQTDASSTAATDATVLDASTLESTHRA